MMRRFATVVTVAMMTTGLAITSAGAIPPSTSPSPTIPPGPPVQFRPRDDFASQPEIPAVGWLVADADSGEILASRGADSRRPPASTLKVLTSVSLLPHLIPTSTYRATRVDEEADGSHAGIVAGGTYRVVDLTHGLLLPSGNDAAMAIAHAYGGVKPAVAQMNREAKRLGAVHTHAVNPSGLDAPGQLSTPRDLATLFRAAMTLPLFRQTVALKSARFPAGPTGKGKKRESFDIWSQDRLLLHGYPGIIGGKSGYTTNAGRTFVGAASRHGHTLIYSLMGVESDTETAARELLDWGFANHNHVYPVGTLPPAARAAAPIQPLPAAQYTADGKMVTPRGKVAGAAAVANSSTANTANDSTPANRSGAISVGVGSISLPWLVPALIAFLALLAVVFVILAARTFRSRG